MVESNGDDAAAISCSICLDVVDGERSIAKLKCGHQFHLDCIGSAFNMKGSMQCPNCRMVEKGNWLYANDVSQAGQEDSVDDWTPGQEPYELAFPELTFSMHWCPFGGLARYRSVREDMDTPSAMNQWLPEHPLFTEQSAASTVSHSYSTYIGQPLLSSAADNFEEAALNHRWNLIPHDDIPVPYGFPALDFQYQSWIHRHPPTSSHIDDIDQVPNPNLIMRPMRDEPMTGSISSSHALLLGQGFATRALGPFLPSGVPLPWGRGHERIIQIPPPVFQQSSIPHVQRNRRHYFEGRPSIVPTMTSHHGQNGSYSVLNPPAMRNPHEVLHPVPSRMHPWDLSSPSLPESVDLNWPSLHESTGLFGSDNNRSGSPGQRHWS